MPPLRQRAESVEAVVVTRVFVAIGSNLGDREAHISQACTDIEALAGCSNLRCSSVYETDPMGPQNQPDYLNAVCGFNCECSAEQLFLQLQAIEQAHGRTQAKERWSARPLDLDILMFGVQQIQSTNLTIPHVGIAERSFVLWPLVELDADMDIPGHGPVQALLAHCERFGIRKFDGTAE